MSDSAETMRKVIDLALAFQDTRAPKYRAPETETARMLMPEGWPTYADLRTIKAALGVTKSDGGFYWPRSSITGDEAAKIVADYLGMRGIGDDGDAANITLILHEGGVRFRHPSDPIPDEREAIARLLTAAKLLQQNAAGCAIYHHGHDCEMNGLPGWLADTKKDIDAAEDAILAMQAERRGAKS